MAIGGIAKKVAAKANDNQGKGGGNSNPKALVGFFGGSAPDKWGQGDRRREGRMARRAFKR